jgi:type IV fimbrial biogenesis protein FimT
VCTRHSGLLTRGFTLIELLMVLVIGGILMMVAGPALYDIIASNRMTGQTNDLMADLAYARSQATSLGTRTTVCASSSGTACGGGNWQLGRIVFADTDGNGSLDAGETLLRATGALSAGTAFTIAGLAAATVIPFRPAGIAAGLNATAATFKMCDSRLGAQAGRTVTVALTGRTSSSKTACP